jgi:hypothetical protein
MKTYRIQVTETINHSYLIAADSVEDALNIYHNYDDTQLKELDEDNQACWDAHPWDVEEVEDDPAALQIAGASSALASPAFTASATPALRSAVNPCTDGDPVGWGVYCSDHSGEWIESGFQDEAAAERFAEAWKNYRQDNTARVGLIISDDRQQWEGEEITAALGCEECEHVAEFAGWVDSHDIAHFPCKNCGAIFEHSEWSEFFDEDDPENEPQHAHKVLAGLARGLHVWIHFKKPEPHTRLMYISLGQYNEDTNRDTFGVHDEKIFYYATPAEIIEAINNPQKTVEGWSVGNVVEWVIE